MIGANTQAVPAHRTLSIKANLAVGGLTIPADFVGYSINPLSVIGGLLNGSATSLINLAKMVGSSGKLRIGGGDQDSSPAPALTQQLANDLGAFLTALGAGWTCIYGLDLIVNDTAVAATQAGYLNTAMGSKVSFQFGNEPLTSGFTTGTYPTRWNSYYTAVVAAVPAAKLMSPDDLQFSSVQTCVNALTPGKAGLTAVTTHWYVSAATPHTAEGLIATVRGNAINVNGTTGFFKNNEWAGSTPLILSESNNFSGGGLSGVSDRLCSATWYLNEAIVFAKYGYAGICTHCNPWWNGTSGWPNGGVVGATAPNIYAPLLLQADLTSFAPGPIFYGLYLFSRIQGQQILAVQTDSNANQTSIATLGSGGNANILVVNNDTTNSLIVTPDQTSAWTTANVLTLSGTGPYDAAPTLGGAAIGVGGSWSGAPVSINSGATVTIPPCGAALISIQP
ncbi:hypothetical protein IVA94_14970 [Bradyrhizobium sp. 156]|uniref:hypothetical protein n=1 Tax=Bradyrhizobium sp. 156 TaxID=2782630 RepID=UPI001FFAC228|nr:hypothetical protein [Bradyrhizobium sp. 156]MCK1322171.1 hypothetical protein [Bradyrhizobium sp. 156]